MKLGLNKPIKSSEKSRIVNEAFLGPKMQKLKSFTKSVH